jgi:hypothetical protein
MRPPRHAELDAACDRLRGHLVATPVLGGWSVPGLALPAGFRVKAELLQAGGSIWFRGAQHCLLRQMRRFKGLLLSGEPRQVLAAAWAAQSQRAPMRAVLAVPPTAAVARMLGMLGCDVEVDAAPDAVGRKLSSETCAGFYRFPGVEDDEYALGIATVVVELAHDLPSTTETLLVSPPLCASAVELGVRMLSLPWRVRTVPPAAAADNADAALALAVREHARVDLDAESVALLRYASAAAVGADACALLGT